MRSYLSIPLALLAALAGCDGDDAHHDHTPTPEATGSPEGTPTLAALEAVCEAPAAVRCEDQLVLDLGLVEGVTSAGEVGNSQSGGVFTTTVDATAGGFGSSADNPWTYVRFTEGGAERVDLDDLDALESMDWHLAFKRYLVRLNGGVSGPSCVGAAEVAGDFDAVDSVPEGTAFHQEDFYTDSCELIPDDKGLGSADVAVGAWWGYTSCVATTGQVFLIQLEDGRVLKLVIDAYYAEGQQGCNDGGGAGAQSANFTARWSFLP